MRKQLKLLSSNKTWSANGRYKVNEVVTFDGQDYQNVTGANSSPDDLVDWFLQPSLNDFILRSGTTLANPITGDLEILGNADLKIYAENSALNNSVVSINFFEDFLGLISTNDDDSSRLDLNVSGLQFSTTSTASKGMVGNAEYNKQGDRKAFAQIADIIDRGVNNTTTIALTSANLNSAYPSATTGFKVYCVAIIAGAMVYEKTPTGWVGMAVIIP